MHKADAAEVRAAAARTEAAMMLELQGVKDQKALAEQEAERKATEVAELTSKVRHTSLLGFTFRVSGPVEMLTTLQ